MAQFGASGAPAFGAQTGSLFGGGAFGVAAPSFGATPTPGFANPTPSPTPGLFGASPLTTTPVASGAFGGFAPSSAFGSPTPAYGGATPAFGASTQAFGVSTPGGFGTPGFTPGAPTPGFGTSTLFTTPGTVTTPGFGTPSSTPGFGGSTLFGTPGSSLVGTPGQSSIFQQGTPVQQQFPGQLTTRMAPVAPLPAPLAEREIQNILDSYREDINNSGYTFKHLLFSVTEPSQRHKPLGASDIMWAEAMSKLEAMESGDRERLFPELLLGFKDLSKRLQMQDEVIASDTKRLQATESNVKVLQRQFQVVTLPWLQRLRMKEQQLQRRLLKLTRVIEMLEAKGLRMPLTRSETLLGEKLLSLARQVQPSTELPRRVDSVLSISRLRAGIGNPVILPGQLDQRSLNEIQLVLRKQTEAVSRLASVLKKDMRDIEIMTEDGGKFLGIDLSKRQNRTATAMDFSY